MGTADQIGWQPVPVPPPTYTLKAKAERAVPMAVDDSDLADTQPMPVLTGALADMVDDRELDDLLDRRAAGG